MKFAKLFDIDDNTQVLVTSELDEQEIEAPYRLKIATDYRGILVSAIYSYKDEVICDEAFENYNLEQATTFYSEVVKVIEQED